MPTLIYDSDKSSDVRYLIGCPIPDPFFILSTDSTTTAYLDKRELEVVREHLAKHQKKIRVAALEPYLEKALRMPADIPLAQRIMECILREEGTLGGELTVPNNFPLDMADYLRKNGVKLRVAERLFPERDVKTPEEIAAIEAALQKTIKAYSLIEDILEQSMVVGDHLTLNGDILTSEWLTYEVESLLLKDNLLCTEGMIISSGVHSSMPHHRGSGPIKAHWPIVCDLFPRDRSSDYFADMTRTYVKGQPSKYFVEMYNATKNAQERALDALKPGVTGKEVHEVCVEAFREAGFVTDENGGFIHATGHGLGIDLHEQPVLSSRNTQPLIEGNVVTVEPGLYYPQHGGVRIEDVAVITANGHTNLTNYPKELRIFN